MRDVAQRAGVSTSTVSHVLNGTRYVRPDLAERVRAALDELGYQPNVLARSLRRKQSLTLGMIVPDSANPFFAGIARAIEDTCFARGYSLILANSAGDPDRELQNIATLQSRQVDGLIFVAAGAGDEDLLRVLTSLPIVLVDRDIAGMSVDGGPLDVDAVKVDNLNGGYVATRHLIGLGHRRIGCITGPSATSPSAERVVGFRRALGEGGLETDETLILRGDFGFDSGYVAAQTLLKAGRPPTAVFACNDQMAIGAMAAAVDLHVPVPAGLSIVGFDGITLGSFVRPPLTTMTQPVTRIGQLAAELLLHRLAAPGSPYERKVLAAELAVRGSTAPPG
jgi:LacI family transcriptional regulator